MPVYAWICSKCQNQQSIFATMDKCKEAPICCGEPSERDWGAEHRGFSHKTIFPYVTKNLDGKGTPIEVRDAGHQRELMKKYNKVLRDDAAFEHEECYTDRRGRWQLRDNSRGEHGRWF